MPELPEVENVKRNLEAMGVVGQKFAQVKYLREGLRTPFPKKMPVQVRDAVITQIERRAKYLIFWLSKDSRKTGILSHLGMTGSWRILPSQQDLMTHDHLIFTFQSGLSLVFNDPRRFGILDELPNHDFEENRWLKHLGPEPLSTDFSAEYLFQKSRRSLAPLKTFIMNQKVVVGVGNIYASEVLFRARLRPQKRSGSLSGLDCQKLVAEIKTVLSSAIDRGGSTIRDFKNSYGEVGSFQDELLVYGRAKKPCRTCQTPIRSIAQAGRSTFWCPQCQKSKS